MKISKRIKMPRKLRKAMKQLTYFYLPNNLEEVGEGLKFTTGFAVCNLGKRNTKYTRLAANKVIREHKEREQRAAKMLEKEINKRSNPEKIKEFMEGTLYK